MFLLVCYASPVTQAASDLLSIGCKNWAFDGSDVESATTFLSFKTEDLEFLDPTVIRFGLLDYFCGQVLIKATISSLSQYLGPRIPRESIKSENFELGLNWPIYISLQIVKCWDSLGSYDDEAQE